VHGGVLGLASNTQQRGSSCLRTEGKAKNDDESRKLSLLLISVLVDSAIAALFKTYAWELGNPTLAYS
jgi:hypothetical protein